MKRYNFCVFCLVDLLLFFSCPVFSQSPGDYTASVPSFKVKYPKTDIIAVDYKEEYGFEMLTGKNTDTKIGVQSSVSETVVPLKDFAKINDAIFYDDESIIDGIHASSAKNKAIHFGQQCMDYQSDGIFYSDAKVCVVS